MLKSKPLKQAARARVLGCGTAFDAIQTVLVKGERHESEDGARHESAPLVGRRQPEPDACQAVIPIDVVKTRHADKLSLRPQSERKTVSCFQLIAGSGDELQCVFERNVTIHPGQPLSEGLPMGIDTAEQHFGVFVSQNLEPRLIDVDSHKMKVFLKIW